METLGTIQARYTQLEGLRTSYLRRARDCSELTIPTLVPPEGAGPSTIYRTPYQALGARGVNNLAAKLLLTLFPPNSPFFRLYISEFLLEKLAGREGMRSEIEEAFDSMERAVMGEVETSGLRTSMFEALKQLLVAGNILLFLPDNGGMKVFRLDRYVVKRDPMGNVMETITKESVSPMEVPESIRDVAMQKAQEANGGKPLSAEKTVEVYTRVFRTATNWKVEQEVCGMIIPESRGSYPLGKSPWIALRFIAVDSEDYGRGYVEEYLGDLKSLEGLMKAIVQGSAAASKVLFLVKPNSTTKHKVLAESESGDVREGNAEDVTVLQLDKYNDFRIALDTVKELSERLSHAFLLNSAIQRNAERVTAEEIRYMASELESALGGIYSTLSQEAQLPLVTRFMFRMERQGKLPTLPEGLVKPAIITGVEALGRGNDLNRLKGFMEDIAPLGEEAIGTYLNVEDFIRRAATARGIDAKGLIPTREQIAQRQQQSQQMAMMESLGPQAVSQFGGIAKEVVKQRNGAQAPQ